MDKPPSSPGLLNAPEALAAITKLYTAPEDLVRELARALEPAAIPLGLALCQCKAGKVVAQLHKDEVLVQLVPHHTTADTAIHEQVIRDSALIPAGVVIGEESVVVVGIAKSMPRRAAHIAVCLVAETLRRITSDTALTGSQAETKAAIETSRRALDDYHHQVAGPIIQARDFAERLEPQSKWLRTDIAKIRGLCRRAVRAAETIALFRELESTGSLSVQRASVRLIRVADTIRHAVSDTELLGNPRESKTFDVRETDGFAAVVPGEARVVWDRRLFEHALGAILDNAQKYSDASTEVRITLDWVPDAADRPLHVVVESQGVRLDPTEAHLAVQRGWRSTNAAERHDSGTGLGLWIADKSFRAMGGRLDVSPSRSGTIVRVRLELPWDLIERRPLAR